MDDEDADAPAELTPREPSDDDLLDLCRELNKQGARYVVVGGFAIRAAGFIRGTMDIDLLVETSLENEAKVFKALESLPDQAVLELEPGEVERYTVVRVADEVMVDLMKSASGIDFALGSKNVVTIVREDVSIPFASPSLLWHMKVHTRRAKDEPDLYFLRTLFAEKGLDGPPPL
jgi:hypothetical protein